MTNKKLIAKFKQHQEDRSLVKIITEDGNFLTYFQNSIKSMLLVSDEMAEFESEILKINLSNLESLIKEGIIIRLGKVDGNYSLIISKGNCSTTYTATKENLITMLQKAEDWAEEFLNEKTSNINV